VESAGCTGVGWGNAGAFPVKIGIDVVFAARITKPGPEYLIFTENAYLCRPVAKKVKVLRLNNQKS